VSDKKWELFEKAMTAGVVGGGVWAGRKPAPKSWKGLTKEEDTEVDTAVQHPDKPGEGAKKRQKLSSKDKKVHAVMKEFKQGTLRSGSGVHVQNRDQAVAIAMSESGQSKNIKKSEETMSDKKWKLFEKAEQEMRDQKALIKHADKDRWFEKDALEKSEKSTYGQELEKKFKDSDIKSYIDEVTEGTSDSQPSTSKPGMQNVSAEEAGTKNATKKSVKKADEYERKETEGKKEKDPKGMIIEDKGDTAKEKGKKLSSASSQVFKTEVLKVDNNGQWSIAKAESDPKPLDEVIAGGSVNGSLPSNEDPADKIKSKDLSGMGKTDETRKRLDAERDSIPKQADSNDDFAHVADSKVRAAAVKDTKSSEVDPKNRY
jgi:hypothetical protein